MGIVRQKDKRSGITYAYESVSYWDKEKRQSRSRRRLIGRVGDNGEIIPTDGRCRRDGEYPLRTRRRGPVPVTQIQRSYYGATYLLDTIADSTGVADDLRQCFPDDYRKILSVAYFLILGGSRALMNFRHWAADHLHPHGADLSSQDCSRLFASMTEAQSRSFFRMQGRRRLEKEYWAYDSTSISSYSETLRQVKYGKNKESDHLPQMNLLLLYGERSGLPFCYRRLSGNIPDVKTVNTLVRELDALGYGKVKFVMDRGFYSKDNIDRLYQHHHKFIVAVSTGLSFVKRRIEAVRDTIRDYGSHDAAYGLGVSTATMEWEYAQARPHKGDVLGEKRRMYLHVFYSVQKAAEEELELNDRLDSLREEILAGRRCEAHEAAYARFFEIRDTPKRGLSVTVREDAVREARRGHGFFALVSNEVKEPVAALGIYRGKDVVEKAFGNLKERLNCRRFLTSSEASLNGKLFVEFVALILLAYVHRRMQQKGLYKEYTLEQVLLELDSIQSFCEPGRRPIVGEVLERQRKIYEALGVEPPK